MQILDKSMLGRLWARYLRIERQHNDQRRGRKSTNANETGATSSKKVQPKNQTTSTYDASAFFFPDDSGVLTSTTYRIGLRTVSSLKSEKEVGWDSKERYERWDRRG